MKRARKIVWARTFIREVERPANYCREHRRHKKRQYQVAAVPHLRGESAPQEGAELCPLVAPANRRRVFRRPVVSVTGGRGGGLPDIDLPHFLEQPEAFVFIAPVIRAEAARRNELSLRVFFEK